MGHEFQNLHHVTDPNINKIRNVYKHLINTENVTLCHASRFSDLAHFLEKQNP